MKKEKNSIFRDSFFVSLIISLFVFFSYSFGLFCGVENFFEDLLFQSKPIDDRIVILSIDNESISHIGQWPWPRSVFADIFSKLDRFKPAVVSLDVVMFESSRYGKEDDRKIEDVMNKAKYPIIIPVEAKRLSVDNDKAHSDGFLFPVFNLVKNNNISLAHINLISDKDGVIRNFPLAIKDRNGDSYNSFAYEAYLRSVKNASEEGLRNIEKIVFSGSNGSVRKISIKNFLNEEFPEDYFDNKIIFIGSTASNLHDEAKTPIDDGAEMSGVEIQAQITNMLIKEYRLREIERSNLFIWIFFIALISFLVFSFSSGIISAIVIILFVGIGNLLLISCLFDVGFLVNIVHTNMSLVISFFASSVYRYLKVDREKREMRSVFSKYVSGDVLNEILKDPARVSLGGEEREVTVFFSDVRSFTTLSEGMSPQGLTNFLNKYLTLMTNIILKNRGVVDKYIGDAIMAFWGAPINNSEQVIDAMNSSLKMLSSLSEFNDKNKDNGDPKIDIGIGLNFGRVTVGNMGSEARFDYTVMGDTVNLASRLEGQTKNYGVKIILGESVVEKITNKQIKENSFLIRELDKIKVKGKNKPVRIFELVPRECEKDVLSVLDKFNEMRDLYYEGMWDRSIILAREIVRIYDDGPTKTILSRCVTFIDNPPENWNGVYEMKSK